MTFDPTSAEHLAAFDATLEPLMSTLTSLAHIPADEKHDHQADGQTLTIDEPVPVSPIVAAVARAQGHRTGSMYMGELTCIPKAALADPLLAKLAKALDDPRTPTARALTAILAKIARECPTGAYEAIRKAVG